MQIRHGSIPAHSLPSCPFEHARGAGRCLQRHGYYERYAHPESARTVRILRLLCKFTGKTLSILPDGMLPYRAIGVRALQDHFDVLSGLAGPGPARKDEMDALDGPAQSETLRAGLRRAWLRFGCARRAASLTNFFGQRLARSASPAALWKAIRDTAGELAQILLELAREGKSLLGDYQCLTPS